MIKLIKNVALNAKNAVCCLKPRKVLTYASICTLGPVASWHNGKVMSPVVMADISRVQKNVKEIVVKPIKKTLSDTCVNSKTYQVNWGDYLKNYNFIPKPLLNNESNSYSKEVKILLRIMEDDKACKIKNKEELAKQIVQVANEYKVDPVVIACIAKKESHFAQNVSSKSLKGIMQINEISVVDMYQKHREHLYMPYIKEIKEKYKTPQELFKAIEEDALLNIKVGSLVYKSKFAKARGKVFDSIKFYNNSYLKEHYAKSVFSDVNHYTTNSVLLY